MRFCLRLIVGLAFFYSWQLSAQLPNYVFFEPKWPASTGAEAMISGQRALFTISDSLIRHQYWPEDKLLGKAGGIGYRIAKLALLDVQQDFMLALIQHEVFGHGARFREFGLETLGYKLHPLPPYGVGGGSASSRTPPDRSLTTAERLTRLFSGNEANSWLADRQMARMVLQQSMHYREAQLYLIARNNAMAYTFADYISRDTDRTGDISRYVDNINSIYPSEDRPYTNEKLFAWSLITLLNPMQWYAGWTLGVNHVIDGKHGTDKIPMIGDHIRYLPALDFNLTPFGAEFLFDNYFLRDNQLLKVQLRYGEPSFHRFYGLGVTAYNLKAEKNYQLNARLELWKQPAFQLGGRTLTAIDEGIGGQLELSGSYFPWAQSRFGLYGKMGYKTAGYLRGEPLGEGMILGVGLAVR